MDLAKNRTGKVPVLLVADIEYCWAGGGFGSTATLAVRFGTNRGEMAAPWARQQTRRQEALRTVV
jgi:hypothetical protein